MARKGLSKDIIIEAAIELIQEIGYHGFSMRLLADKLEVKPSSLYNHFKNLEYLTIAVGLRIYETFDDIQEKAINDSKNRQEAVMNLALAYRRFAFENPELYKVTRLLPKIDNAIKPDIVRKWIKPMKHVMSLYNISEEDQMHWQRIYRATITGFVNGEKAGLFVLMPVSTEESFRMGIMNIIVALETQERTEIRKKALVAIDE